MVQAARHHFTAFPSTSDDLRFDVCPHFPPCSWLLYEKPGFQGRTIALEEGPTDHIVNVWAEEETPTTLDQMGEPVPTTPLVIGSIRLAVQVSSDFVLLFDFKNIEKDTICVL